jgi:hypothetical protein
LNQISISDSPALIASFHVPFLHGSGDLGLRCA